MSRPCLQVVDGSLEELNLVLEVPEPEIAMTAKKPMHLACFVVVVNGEEPWMLLRAMPDTTYLTASIGSSQLFDQPTFGDPELSCGL